MRSVPLALTALSDRLDGLGWVSDLWVAGSLATGDFVPGVSDLDLVAVTTGPVGASRERQLIDVHRVLDSGIAAGSDLGCVYVDEHELASCEALHPTWTHGKLVQRSLSGITRVELVRHGFAIYGRPPSTLFAPFTEDQVRSAACEEVCGYWALAARRPLWWLNPAMVDLGLTSMARGRHALRTGELSTKSDAIEHADAPEWLIGEVRARRRGEQVTSPRIRSAWIAWRDARRTVRASCPR